MCCKAMTKECLACTHNTSVDKFCEANPGKYDCPEVEKTEYAIFWEDQNNTGHSHGFGLGKFNCNVFKNSI